MQKDKRTGLGLVFGVVFLDIVGFSVIFPLFPEMLEHYLALEGEGSTIGRLAARLDSMASGDRLAVETFFGGLLGTLYSLLQFLFAPIWGSLSDRHGRRPILGLTLLGTALSYVLWIFAGSFGLLIAARVFGGIMAGNISTATAVVADTTSGRDRAKGMGIVGMAIGLGFILGPALGALSTKLSFGDGESWQSGFALNPFSGAAVLSLGLAALNLLLFFTRFAETLPPEKRGQGAGHHTLNPLGRLGELRFPGVPRTNLAYLAYLTAFSAMEFTLTFLARERLGWSAVDQAWMFVFVGFVIALVQGGVVRRMAPRLGEKRLTLTGLVLLIPGFVIIGRATSGGALYAGLFPMAVGSALVMPCLSALVSRYTPTDRQGLSLGTFRSMGALSRAIGPILGGTLYWRFSSAAPYYAAAAFIVVPLLLAATLPEPPQEAEPEPQGAA